MEAKSLAVSLTASREYRDAMTMVARQRGVTVGRLVRAALDEMYGAEIENALSFFQPDGINIYHTVNTDTADPSRINPTPSEN